VSSKSGGARTLLIGYGFPWPSRRRADVISGCYEQALVRLAVRWLRVMKELRRCWQICWSSPATLTSLAIYAVARFCPWAN